MDAKPEVISQLVQFAQFTLGIVWERVLLLASMLLTAGAFAWVLYAPDVIRLIAACAFAVLVFYPVVRLELNRSKGA